MAALVSATALGPFSIQIFLPALPAIQAGFGVAPGLAQFALTASMLLINKLRIYYYKPAPGSEGGHVRYLPQLWIYPRRPSADEVKRFEELLKIARDKQVEKSRIEHEEVIPYARELERFDKLRRDEILTEEEFALVKAKLLNLRPRRIGF